MPTGDSVCPFAARASGRSAPPVPVSAADHFGLTCTVDFDQDLQPGLLDHTNWTVRYNNLAFTISTAAIAGPQPRTVGLYYNLPGLPSPGPNIVNYAPPPFDVQNLYGDKAATFSGFPVT
jgi:hypothetical protein